MVFHTIKDLEKKAQTLKERRTVAVARAEDSHVIEAALRAQKDGFAQPLFIGDMNAIQSIAEELGEKVPDNQIINMKNASSQEICDKAVEVVREGRAQVIMKGLLNTADVLRAALNKEHGLKHGPLITQFSFAQFPGYHKLVILNDAAITPYPTLEQKAEQIRLVTKNLRKAGYDECIKVAALAAAETYAPKIIESREARELKKMCERGEFPGTYVEGPISLDIALNSEIAKKKKFDSPVSGDADVLLFPNMVSGNFTSKMLTVFAGGYSTGVVIGAEVPISLTSRAATAEAKYCSLAVACLLAERK